MTIHIATDFSDASGTLLFDINKKEWSLDIIIAIGFSSSLFPDILNSIDISGKVT